MFLGIVLKRNSSWKYFSLELAICKKDWTRAGIISWLICIRGREQISSPPTNIVSTCFLYFPKICEFLNQILKLWSKIQKETFLYLPLHSQIAISRYCILIKNLLTSQVYSQPCQTSKTELFSFITSALNNFTGI